MSEPIGAVDRVEMVEELQVAAAWKGIEERKAKSTLLDTPQGQKFASKYPALPSFFKSEA